MGTEARQLERLRRVIGEVLPGNAFYAPRLQAAGIDEGIASLEDFAARMPFTRKQELATDQQEKGPYGSNLSYPIEKYTRLHRTSSTTGKPLKWLDTQESWSWMTEAWAEVLRGAGVSAKDRAMVAFSFGPFIGLWLGFEAAQRLGALTIPGGAMNSEGRIEAILQNQVTLLSCTPTYALRLGEVAHELGIDLGQSSVRKIVVGGEPGASVPATRRMIEAAWPGAELFDHYGLTEVGPVTFQCGQNQDLVHVLEDFQFCEIIDPETGEVLPADSGAVGELVITNLGRAGSPVLRYRTRDLVARWQGDACACGREGLSFAGGIIGRADDMVVVRGVNLYPTAVDQLVRSSTEILEYQVRIHKERGMSELEIHIEVEPAADETTVCAQVEKAFRDTYALRIPVTASPAGSLPRFELKARRWIRE